MKIAVTGGAGFIGSRLVRALKSQGHDVVAIDLMQPPQSTDIQVCIANVCSLDELHQPLEGVDAVYHLAGLVLEGVRKNPYGSFNINVMGTLNALEACRLNGVKRFLFASSFYVYDSILTEGQVDESSTLEALKMELFGFTKLAGEVQVREYARKQGIQGTVLRFGSAYGPGNSSNVVRTFIELALAKKPIDIWGEGRRRNQYTFVDDIAQGCVKALDFPGETFNLINPEVTSVGQLAEMVKRKLGAQVTYDTTKKEGASMPYMSSEKAERLMGWKNVSLEEGFNRTLKEQYGIS